MEEANYGNHYYGNNRRGPADFRSFWHQLTFEIGKDRLEHPSTYDPGMGTPLHLEHSSIFQDSP